MFTWLSEYTHELLLWVRVLLEFLEDVTEMREEEYSWGAIRDFMQKYGIEDCPQQVWDAIAERFPDLLDEINDIRLRIYNDGKHPDSEV